jgi:DNA-binding response OmpR family regulator
VEEVVDSFRQIAETKGFDFDIQLPAEPLVLWIDVEKISSAIRNLLSNAFKYTSPRGRVILRMERVQIDGQAFCKLTVSDTGKGIPEELQERVFDSFITGDQVPMLSTKVGIGLRIVKNTMDLHHGSISLKSSPQEGSTFVLAIPEGNAHFSEDKYELVETPVNEETDIPVPVSSSVAEQKKEAGNKKSLLIIEDNEEVRAYICSLFCKNYTLYEAANGEEGVRIATEKIPNLIISDIMMPVKDGFVCCREIRERPCTAHIPILMLTAKAEDADILYGSKVGADDYILKPFNPEILKSRVENLILQRERLKRIYTKALMLKQKETKQGEAEEVADDFMKGVIQVIEANLADENFNVKILAEQLNMSQPTLYRKIKQRSELAAIDIIRSIRMSKAASLIMENRYSIQEIAEMVGYSDTRTLRKHFTEQFGVSPSKYIDKPEMQGS